MLCCMLCGQPVDVGLVLKLQQKLKSVESERDRLHRRLEKHDDSPSEHKAQDNFKVTLYKHLLYFFILRGLFRKVNSVEKDGGSIQTWHKLCRHRAVVLARLSIEPVIPKINERAVHSRSVDFLDVINLFDDEQHGFGSGRSVLIVGIDLVVTIIDTEGENTVEIFLDLSKGPVTFGLEPPPPQAFTHP